MGSLGSQIIKGLQELRQHVSSAFVAGAVLLEGPGSLLSSANLKSNLSLSGAGVRGLYHTWLRKIQLAK